METPFARATVCSMLGTLILAMLPACSVDSYLSTQNEPPEVAMASPAEGSRLVAGEVDFLVAISDDSTALEDLVVVFSSDLQGGLDGVLESRDGGIQFVAEALEVGIHTVTVRVTDEGAQVGEDSVSLELLPNTPPNITILAPEDGEKVADGSTVELSILVSDTTEGDVQDLTLVWFEFNGVIPGGMTHPDGDGRASHLFEGLEPGNHSLGCNVTDSHGELVSMSVAIEVLLPDADGDGFTTDQLGGDDCDDSDPAVNPDAVEICDEFDVDEDCDGLADNDDPEVSDPVQAWPDSDGDGFGDGTAVFMTCQPEDGVDNGGDCNDADASVHPEASEVCDDGVDNDCDGTWNSCRYAGENNIYSSDAVIYGAEATDRSSYSLDAGDLDGDGVGDLLIGAYQNSQVDQETGSVHVSWGPHLGESMLGAGEPIWTGETRNANAGYAVAVVGDLDGDGLPDLVAGAPTDDSDENNAGRAYLVSGGFSGGGSLGDEAFWTGSATGANLGFSVSSAGDVDGDGLADLLLGACYDSTLYSEGGAAYLMLGPATSVGDIDGVYDARFRPEESEDGLGYRVGAAGDVDGDGLDDVLIAAPLRNDLSSDSGVVYLVLGDASSHWAGISQRVNSAHAKLLGHEAGLKAGTALEGMGDLDGDGFGEILVGAESSSGPGSAFLLRGPLTGEISLANADVRFSGDMAESSIGHDLASGDVDGDGEIDVLIGGYTYPGSGESGQVTLLHGPLLSLGPTVDMALGLDATWEGANSRDWLGASLAMHDMDSDGKDELIIGVPRDDSEETDGGAAFVFAGRGL